MARYNPMTFATGLTGLRGQRGESGALWQAKETSKSKKAITDWLERENQRIQEAASGAGKGSLWGQGLGYLTGLIAYASGLGPVWSALAAAGVGGATDYRISEKATRDAVKMGALPGVLFGKEALRESGGTVRRAGRNVREGGLSQWIGTGLGVGKNVYSIANLHQFLNPANPAGKGGAPNAIDITSRAPSAGDIYIDSGGYPAAKGGFGKGNPMFSRNPAGVDMGFDENLLNTLAPSRDFSVIASPEGEILNMLKSPSQSGRLHSSIFSLPQYDDYITNYLNEKFMSNIPKTAGKDRLKRVSDSLIGRRYSFIDQYLEDDGLGIDAYLKSLRGGR